MHEFFLWGDPVNGHAWDPAAPNPVGSKRTNERSEVCAVALILRDSDSEGNFRQPPQNGVDNWRVKSAKTKQMMMTCVDSFCSGNGHSWLPAAVALRKPGLNLVRAVGFHGAQQQCKCHGTGRRRGLRLSSCKIVALPLFLCGNSRGKHD